jgi:putative peptidoglycan lipid II flippase
MQQTSSDVQHRIKRASYLLLGSILVSRIIGFFREWVLAHTVGANGLTDVYYASFTIPDFLNYLMAAGALSISFIPVLSAMVTSGKTEEAKRLFRVTFTLMGTVLAILIVIAEIFARDLAEWVSPGFSNDQLELLTFLIRIILPAQLFFYFGGVATAVQHTHGLFIYSAFSPIFYNVGIIVFGLFMQAEHGVVGFSVGVLVGAAVGHGLLQWIGLRKLGYSALPDFRPSPEVWAGVKRYLWLSVPIMMGFSIVVTDEWFAKYFASSLGPAAVSYLQYARTQMRIPVAVIGQVAGVASFPFLARLWAAGDVASYGKTLLREIQKLWAASLVATILFVTHAEPLTRFIYGGGKFTEADVLATSAVLRYFGLGMFFLTVQGLLSRGFYACQKTWLPSLVGGLTSVLSAGVYWYLAEKWQVRGLAMAGSLSFAVYAVSLWCLLRAHLRRHCPELSLSPFYRFCGLWALAGVGFWLVAEGLLRLPLYQGTRLTAALDIVVATAVLGGLAIGLLRKAFARLTAGALF